MTMPDGVPQDRDAPASPMPPQSGERTMAPRATRGARLSLSSKATEKRYDAAIDIVLNSGLMYGDYIDAFWRFVDGEITEDEMRRVFP